MARRANKKFIIQMSVIGVLLITGVTLAGMWKLVWSKNPLPHIAAGDEAMQQGRYEAAVEAYAKAIRLKDLDLNVWIKLGDAQNHMSGEDVNSIFKAQQIWETALGQNPQFLAAHQRLLTHFKELAGSTTGARRIQSLERAETTANNILRIAPDDKQAKVVARTAGIERWLAGQPVNDPLKVNELLTELRKLYEEQPSDPDLAFTLARGLAQQGVEAFRRGEREETTRLWDEALDVMQKAVAANPTDGRFPLRLAQLMTGIGVRADKLTDRDEVKARELGLQNIQACADLAVQAAPLLKPDMPDYMEEVLTASTLVQRAGRGPESEKILRAAIEAVPDELSFRLALVDVIRSRPGGTQESIDLLTKAPPQAKSRPGVAGQINKDAQQRSQLILADLKLDQYIAARPQATPEESSKLMSEIQDLLAKAIAKEPTETARSLRVRGKMELFQGDAVSAVTTLRRALEIAGDPNDRTHLEVKYLLARAFLTTDQTGEAERLFREIADRLDYFPARTELVRLLLRKGALSDADRYLVALEQSQPDSIEVIGLRMAYVELANKDRTPEEVKRNLDRLPEDNVQRQLYKGRIALAAKQFDEALRLFTLASKQVPDDRNLAMMIAQAYEAKGARDEAATFLEGFLKQHPDSPALRLALERVRGASQEQLRTLGRKELEAIADPLTRNLMLFEFDQQTGDLQGTAAAVAELVKIAPEDPRVVEARFQQAMRAGDDAEAQRALELIEKLNVDGANGKVARARYLYTVAIREPDYRQRQEKLQSAINAAVDLTQFRGDYDTVWVILGQANQAAGQLDEAINAYNQAINRKPQNREALEGLIRCHYGKKNVSETKKFIDQALAIYPRSRTFIEFNVSWLVEFGDPKLAITQREADLKEAPDNPLSYGNLAGAYAVAAVKTEDDAERRKLREKGWEIVKQGVDKFPNDIELVSLFADLSNLLDRFADGEKAWLALATDAEIAKSPIIAQRIAAYYRKAGRYDDAIKYCLAFLEKQESPGVRVFLADTYLLQKDAVNAEKQLGLAGDDPMALKRRIELLLAAGKAEEAEKIIAEALQKSPNDPALLNRLAFIYLSRNDMAKAKETIDRVLGNAPQDSQALFFKALIASQEGRLDESLDIVNRLRSLEPDNPDVRKLAAELFKQQNNTAMALSELESVLAADPNEKSTRIQLIESYLAANPPRINDADRLVREGSKLPGLASDPQFAHAAARLFYAKGDYKQAMDQLKDLIKLNPSDLAMQDTYFRIMMAAKQYETVVSTTTSLLEQVKAPWIYSTRATAKARLKQVDKAMEDFQAGYQLAADSGDDFGQQNMIRGMLGEIGADAALKFLSTRAKGTDLDKIYLAQVYTTTNRFSEALELVRDVYPRRSQLETKPRLSFLKLAGAVAISVSPPDLSLGREAYEEYLKAVPGDYQAHNNLACLLMMPGSGASPAEAEAVAKRAVEEMTKINVPKDPLVLDTYGAALLGTGKVDEAIIILREALLVREFPDAFIHLADGLHRKGEIGDAAQSLDKAQAFIDSAKSKGGVAGQADLERRIADLRLKLTSAPPSN